MDLRAEVERAIWQESGLRSLVRDSLRVEARRGEVTLSGHVASVMNRTRLEDLAWSVPGVLAVHNEIVADTDLVTAVSQALAADPRTRPHIIYVGAFHGWVRLGGRVPTAEAQAAAEEVAAQVPHVRGVLTLPAVQAVDYVSQNRRPVQPIPGTAVYASDGAVGTVAHVIIDPRNRLVSHVVVAGRMEVDEQLVKGTFVVPVEAIDHVTAAGVLLRDTAREVAARPAFDPAAYPSAPAEWRPPFPYEESDVRWPATAKAQEQADEVPAEERTEEPPVEERAELPADWPRRSRRQPHGAGLRVDA